MVVGASESMMSSLKTSQASYSIYDTINWAIENEIIKMKIIKALLTNSSLRKLQMIVIRQSPFMMSCWRG